MAGKLCRRAQTTSNSFMMRLHATFVSTDVHSCWMTWPVGSVLKIPGDDWERIRDMPWTKSFQSLAARASVIVEPWVNLVESLVWNTEKRALLRMNFDHIEHTWKYIDSFICKRTCELSSSRSERSKAVLDSYGYLWIYLAWNYFDVNTDVSLPVIRAFKLRWWRMKNDDSKIHYRKICETIQTLTRRNTTKWQVRSGARISTGWLNLHAQSKSTTSASAARPVVCLSPWDGTTAEASREVCLSATSPPVGTVATATSAMIWTSSPPRTAEIMTVDRVHFSSF